MPHAPAYVKPQKEKSRYKFYIFRDGSHTHTLTFLYPNTIVTHRYTLSSHIILIHSTATRNHAASLSQKQVCHRVSHNTERTTLPMMLVPLSNTHFAVFHRLLLLPCLPVSYLMPIPYLLEEAMPRPGSSTTAENSIGLEIARGTSNLFC